MLSPYVPIVTMFCLATLFVGFSVLVSARHVGPRRFSRTKAEAYECGIEPTPQGPGYPPLPREVLPHGDAFHHFRH